MLEESLPFNVLQTGWGQAYLTLASSPKCCIYLEIQCVHIGPFKGWCILVSLIDLQQCVPWHPVVHPSHNALFTKMRFTKTTDYSSTVSFIFNSIWFSTFLRAEFHWRYPSCLGFWTHTLLCEEQDPAAWPFRTRAHLPKFTTKLCWVLGSHFIVIYLCYNWDQFYNGIKYILVLWESLCIV